MRFTDFIRQGLSEEGAIKVAQSPEAAAELIYRDCQPYLRAIGGQVNDVSKQLQRGIRVHDDPEFDLMKARKYRKSRDMSDQIHRLLDDFFDKHFGVGYRSQGTFATGSTAAADAYGQVYLMFPRGNFDFAWSTIVEDAFAFFDGFVYGDDPVVLGKYQDYFSISEIVTIDDHDDTLDAIDNYVSELERAMRREDFGYRQNVDLPGAIESGHEIMVNCESYYIIQLDAQGKLARPTPAAQQILDHLVSLIEGRPVNKDAD